MSEFSAGKLDALITSLKQKTGHHWTIRQIANKVDISPGYLTLLKKGQRSKPSMDVVIKLSQFFDVKPETFFEVEGNQAEPHLLVGERPQPVQPTSNWGSMQTHVQQTLQVCEQLLANANYRQTLELLSMLLTPDSDIASQPDLFAEVNFLKARALAGLGQFHEVNEIIETYLDPAHPSYLRAQALSIRGRMFFQREQYGQAIEDFLQAKVLAEDVQASELLYRIHFTLGLCYKELSEYGASIYHLEYANQMFPSSFPKAVRAHLMIGMGNTYLRLNNPKAASRVYLEAEKMFRDLGDAKLLADVKHSLARIDLYNGDAEAALEKFRSCLQAHQSVGDYLGIGHDLYEMALCQKELQNWEQVSDLALRAMITYENGNVVRLAAKSKMLLIEAKLHVVGDTAQAMQALQEIKTIFKELNLYTELSKAMRLQAEIYQTVGKSEEAMKMSMEAFDLYAATNRMGDQ